MSYLDLLLNQAWYTSQVIINCGSSIYGNHGKIYYKCGQGLLKIEADFEVKELTKDIPEV